ncbi:MAG TPA: cobalamin-dependent protein, partial [bacterium]|nr:cobalamin-dependent protein [bacterium]
MTDILIVNSSSEEYGETATGYPLGVCYLAAAAETAGFGTAFFDSYRTPWPAARAGFEKILRETRPLAVGFSCLSFNRNSARDAARLVKNIDPGAVTIFGGPHATPMQDQILENYDA